MISSQFTSEYFNHLFYMYQISFCYFMVILLGEIAFLLGKVVLSLYNFSVFHRYLGLCVDFGAYTTMKRVYMHVKCQKPSIWTAICRLTLRKNEK